MAECFPASEAGGVDNYLTKQVDCLVQAKRFVVDFELLVAAEDKPVADNRSDGLAQHAAALAAPSFQSSEQLVHVDDLYD